MNELEERLASTARANEHHVSNNGYLENYFVWWKRGEINGRGLISVVTFFRLTWLPVHCLHPAWMAWHGSLGPAQDKAQVP